MMLTRAQIYHTMEKLPEPFPIEHLIEQLVFINKVERGLEQSRSGQINSVEQTKNKLSKWLK